VFAPVWSVLYLLMAVAAWRVTLAPASPLRSVALVLFLVQLGLNLAWSWIFFRRHALATALGEILLLWVTVAATIVAFTPVARAGAWMMIPYLAWVTFAAIFNAGFWRLNP
jgi:tryptophan-rich sensory protein